MKIEDKIGNRYTNNTNAFIVIDLLLIPGSKSLSPDGQTKVERLTRWNSPLPGVTPIILLFLQSQVKETARLILLVQANWWLPKVVRCNTCESFLLRTWYNFQASYFANTTMSGFIFPRSTKHYTPWCNLKEVCNIWNIIHNTQARGSIGLQIWDDILINSMVNLPQEWNFGMPTNLSSPATPLSTLTATPKVTFLLTWCHTFNASTYKITATCTECATVLQANITCNMWVPYNATTLVQQQSMYHNLKMMNVEASKQSNKFRTVWQPLPKRPSEE